MNHTMNTDISVLYNDPILTDLLRNLRLCRLYHPRENESNSKMNHLRYLSEKDINEGRTIFIDNLAYHVTDHRLAKFLGGYGYILSINVEKRISSLISNNPTFYNKGYAYITFKFQEDAMNVISILDGKIEKGISRINIPLRLCLVS